jgi:hypothetical protein
MRRNTGTAAFEKTGYRPSLAACRPVSDTRRADLNVRSRGEGTAGFAGRITEKAECAIERPLSATSR